MNSKILTVFLALTASRLVAPVQAQEPTNDESPKLTQIQNACINNQAETLPNPFSDLPANHWAFKAVLTMHYCGAFRQATPPALFEKFQLNERQNPTNSTDASQSNSKLR